ncbi:protoporphyrinogen/coproporphyrinogen oxidase [Candidatus Dependentiae bacterium]
MAEIVILGSGLTGLCTAYHLEKRGFFDFKIFEKENISGGLLRSFYQDNFTFDFTGHLLHINNNQFRDFIENISGLNKFNYIQRKSFIYLNQNFTPYPFQTNLANLSPKIIIDSIDGFVNRKKNIKKPKSFYHWVLKYFGKGMGKYFFFNYNKKLLSYDIKKITSSWTGRFIPQTNLQAILSSVLNNKDQTNIGYNNHFYYPKNDGIMYLINKLTKSIKTKTHTLHNATKINLKTKTINFENGHKEKFKTLINTTPLNTFLKSLDGNSSLSLNNASKKLLCNSVLNFNLGFNVANLSNKHWIYFPETKYSFYRIGFWQNFSLNSVKKNCSAIYGEISYIPGTKTSRQILNLKKKAIDQTLKIWGLNENNIVTQNNLILPHAYVIYDFWREKNLKKIHSILNKLSIHSVGRYGEWKYSSMQEAFLDGKKTAELILKKLNKIPPHKNTTNFIFNKKDNKSETL